MAGSRAQWLERPVARPTILEFELTRLLAALKRLDDIEGAEVPAVLSELAMAQTSLAAAQAALASRMFSGTDCRPTGPEPGDERWLTAEEAAAVLKVHRKWLYRRANTLPFCRRLSRKKLLFSDIGLRQWMANRRA
jgi:hypothetical protein